MWQIRRRKIARKDQVSVFALNLLESDKCFNYEIATRTEIKRWI